MNGREETDRVGELLRRAMPDDLPGAVEQRLQQRLAAFERFDATASTEPLEPASPWCRMSHWMGGLSMRKRIGIAFGGTGVAALLAMLLLWSGDLARPVSAMDKMAQCVRQAKSYKSTITSISQWREITPKGTTTPRRVTRRTTQTTYYLADGSCRTETEDRITKGSPPEEDGVTKRFTHIYPAGNPGLQLNHQTKTYRRLPPAKPDAFMDEVQSLGNFAGRADRELGIKTINGKKARGFQFDDARRLLPHNSPPEQTVDVWIDIESNLPIRLEAERKPKDNSVTMDIQWNLDLEPRLFDTTPPEGYTESEPKPPSS